MSLLTEPLATPSRVRGLYRLVLREPKQQIEAAEALSLLAPQSLQGTHDRSMADRTLGACVDLRLLTEPKRGWISIGGDLPTEARDPDRGDSLLPDLVAQQVFSSDNPTNHDLALALAWLLAQDPYRPFADQTDFERRLQEQVGGSRLEVTNNVRYGSLQDWASYLGLCRLDGGTWGPDPTAWLRRNLDQLVRPGQDRSFPQVMSALGKLAPAFEGGRFRDKLARQAKLPPVAEGCISLATSLGWLRLEQEQDIVLEARADAPSAVLSDPSGPRRVTDVKRSSHRRK